jgi:hypothetical protein
MAKIITKVLTYDLTTKKIDCRGAYEVVLLNIGTNDAEVKTSLGGRIRLPAGSPQLKLIAPPKDTFDEILELVTDKCAVQVVYVQKSK